MHRAMLLLQVKDVERSLAFYCDKLGFRFCGIRGDGPNFAIVGRGGVTVALDRSQSDRPTPINQYWAAYIYVDDADALHDEFLKRGVEIVRGPEDMFYGSRDFDMRDPDGHILAFGQDLNPDNP